MATRNGSWHLTLATAMLALAPSFGVTARPLEGPAVTPQVDATNPVASVDPRVPPAAGQPCVAELLHNRAWPQEGVEMEVDPTVIYTPPRACPPPWSKVILKMDLRSSRRTVLDSIGMDLARVRLFRSGAPHYDGESSWHIERDLTDYSALFRVPHTGRIWSSQNPESVDWGWNDGQPVYHASAQLFFYPSTAATPAPRVPDAVIGVNRDTPVNLPHNVVRAYLDVENVFPSRDLIWYTCWTDDSTHVLLGDFLAPGTNQKNALNPPDEGCGGGSFREVKVRVDGTPAGIAPGFPLVIADLNWSEDLFNNADLPIPTLEMLNAKPYRRDLSPFAAILSAPGAHNVVTSNPVLNEMVGGRPGGATLLLYLDPHRSQVTGAVTLNTLATQSGAPTDINTLSQSGTTVVGDIRLQQHRDFIIRGFVDTSSGRIDSSVHQTGDFSSLQKYHLVGQGLPDQYDTPVEKLYAEDVWLTNAAVQTSRRSQGTRLISWDQVTTHYPLQFTWRVASTGDIIEARTFDLHRTNVTVLQSRVVDGDHYKPGFGHFTTHAGARFYSTRKGGDEQTDPRWESYTTRNYKDNFGSCYHGDMSSRDGGIVQLSKGAPCPGGRNHVRWFAHPDGSPGTLGWWH